MMSTKDIKLSFLSNLLVKKIRRNDIEIKGQEKNHGV